MAKLTRKIRRSLSTEESIYRYFATRQREQDEDWARRWRLCQVEQEQADGTVVVLQVRRVLASDHGVILRVR